MWKILILILSATYFFYSILKHFFLKTDKKPKIAADNLFTCIKKTTLNSNTVIFRLATPKPINLSVGSHVRLWAPNTMGKKSGEWNGKPDLDSKEMIFRKYTPINVTDTYIDVLVKIYRCNDKFIDGGKMSRYLDNFSVNQKIKVDYPFGIIKYQGQGEFSYLKKELKCKNICMIAGGSGITPMYQIIKAVIDSPADSTKLHLLYANVSIQDILLKNELDEMASTGELNLSYTVDKIKPTESWNGFTGFITQEMIATCFPDTLKTECLFLLCGPPPMIKFACRNNLEKLGVSNKQILQF